MICAGAWRDIQPNSNTEQDTNTRAKCASHSIPHFRTHTNTNHCRSCACNIVANNFGSRGSTDADTDWSSVV